MIRPDPHLQRGKMSIETLTATHVPQHRYIQCHVQITWRTERRETKIGERKGGTFTNPSSLLSPFPLAPFLSLSLKFSLSISSSISLSLPSSIHFTSLSSPLKLHFHLISLPQVCQSLSLTHCTPLIYQHSNSPFLHLHSLLFSQIMKFWGFVLLGFVIFGSAVLPSSRLVGNGTKGEK